MLVWQQGRSLWGLNFFEKPIVNTKKKTLYDLLAVSPNATQQDIQTTYDSLLAGLQSQRSMFNAEDYRLKLQLIELAFATLSSPTSRRAYDQELAQLGGMTDPAPSTLALVAKVDPVSIALRAEAMSLRAEAISLRADALSIRSEAATFRGSDRRAASSQDGLGAVMPALRKLLMLVGAVVAVWMVFQVMFLWAANRRIEANTGAATTANEKSALQEYYQNHGVMPANKTEADLLEAENRRKDIENRAAERAALKSEDDSKRFEEESRRRAREVSAELRDAESQAREQAMREDEQKRYQAEEKKRRAEEAETNRIEREKQKWQDTLRR